MTLHQGPVTAPTTRPVEEPAALPIVAQSGPLTPSERFYLDALLMAEQAGYQRGYAAGLQAADDHATALHKAASVVTEWVAKDLHSGRQEKRQQRARDRQAAALHARAHRPMRELVPTP